MKRNSIKKRIMCIVFSALVILATCATSPIKVYADGVDIDNKYFTMMTGGEATLKAGDELSDVEDPSKKCSVNDLVLISVYNGTLTMSTNGTNVAIGNDDLSVHIYGSGKLLLTPLTMLTCSTFLWDVSDSSGISGLISVGDTFTIGDDIAADFTFAGSSLNANKIAVNKGNFTNNSNTTATLINIQSGTTASNTNNMTATTFENYGIFVNEGNGVLTTDLFVNNHMVTNVGNGTIDAEIFENAGTFTNNAAISCEKAVISGKILGTGTFNVSDTLTIKKSEGEIYNVADGATVIFDEDLTQAGDLPTIITGPNTTITDVGHKASYKLKVGTGEVKEITTGTGWADTIPAGELNKKQRSLSISGSASIYYGVEYTEDFFTSQISDLDDVAIEFDGCTFQDVTNPDNPVTLTELPTNVGTYKVFTKIKATSEYRDCGTYFPAIPDTFLISYFPSTELSEKCTLSAEPVCTIGSSNYNLYKGGVKYIAPAGFSISNELDGTYAKSITLEEGYNYGSDDIYYKRDEDGATTNAVSYTAYPFLVDNSNPEIIYSSDQDGEDVVIKEGTSTVRARSVSITIEDMVSDFSTIDSVTLNGSTDGVSIGSDGRVEVALKMILPGKKTYEIVATDLVGHTSKWTINMEYLPTATPETPYTVRGLEGKNGYYTSDVTLIPAEGYTISADVNGTFTDTIIYKPEIENVYLMDSAGLFTEPIAVGSYLIDKSKPQFTVGSDESGNTYDIADGLEVHAKSLSFSISDENLATVTVNGEAVDIAAGTAAVELVPEAGKTGNYEIYAEDIAGNSIQATVSVEHLKNVATVNLSVDAKYAGQKIEPALITNSDGEAAYYYKREGASDDTYVSEQPNAAGDYIVQVRIPATDRFTAVNKEAKFSLSYLEKPKVTYSADGKTGNNDFYTSDVKLVAPEGFKISAGSAGPYDNYIIYEEGMDKIYLMRDDGALTGAIAFNEKYKIDKLSPEPSLKGTLTNNKTLKTKSIDIKNGLSIFADTLDFSIFDENLMTITINGETVEFNEKTAKILLDANNTTSKFNIVAEDKAGNTTSLSVVLKATWLENNIIPAGAKITLEAGQVYNLEGGKWTVSGDSTVYYGGNKFCVDGSMDCVFTETK